MFKDAMQLKLFAQQTLTPLFPVRIGVTQDTSLSARIRSGKNLLQAHMHPRPRQTNPPALTSGHALHPKCPQSCTMLVNLPPSLQAYSYDIRTQHTVRLLV